MKLTDMKKKKKIFITFLSILIIVLIAFFMTTFKIWDEKYFHIFRNDEATCIGCFTHIGLALRMYSNEHYEYPAGRKTPMESLNIIFGDGEQPVFAANMASHDQRAEFTEYYQQHRKIPENLSIYRYNEGLTEDAPIESILLYYYKPTKWASRGRSKSELGRTVLLLDGSFPFYPEAKFQQMQKVTLKWIEHRRLRAKDREKMISYLKLDLKCVSVAKRKYRLKAKLINNSSEEISINFLGHGSLAGVCMFEPFQKTPKITLPAKGTFEFPMENIISTNYRMQKGKIRRITVSRKGATSSGYWSRDFNPSASFEKVYDKIKLEADILMRAETKTVPKVSFRLFSEKIKFLNQEDVEDSSSTVETKP